MRVRSLSSATGSTTPTDTPDRSHTSLVNAAASKPGGNRRLPPTPAGREVMSPSAWSSCWSVRRFVTVLIPDRCATQTTTCCTVANFELLYVDFEFHRVTCGRWESQPPVPAHCRNHGRPYGGVDSTPPESAPESGAPRDGSSKRDRWCRFGSTARRSTGCVDSTPPHIPALGVPIRLPRNVAPAATFPLARPRTPTHWCEVSCFRARSGSA